MAAIEYDQDAFTVRLTPLEQLLGTVRSFRVPVSAVREVEVVQDALRATRGMRAPGTDVPRRRKLGVWRRRGARAYVNVRRAQPALRIALTGHRFDELLLGLDDADAARQRLLRESSR